MNLNWYQIKAESVLHCSLQCYQKLILPKMSFVPCFVGGHHILRTTVVHFFHLVKV